MESPPSALNLGRRQSHAGRATVLACVGQWARPTVLGLGLKCQPSTVRRFSEFQFLFNISEIHINFKNAKKIQYYLEKYDTNFYILHKSSSTHKK
jgi:hypothetical protein